MTPAQACPRCASALSNAFCHACVLSSAFEDALEWIGDYGLLSELDAGGSCTVHIARRRGQEGLFAVKLAKAELVQSPEGAAAYRSGLRIQKSLCREPNILSVDEIGTHVDGRPYAAMSLLTGGTLADPAVRARYAEPRAALELVLKLSKAVARAHQRTVLHADLKPDNILFDDDGEPFISDFGLARVLDDSPAISSPALQGGTIGWMSPEQVERVELTLASDVFSLGVLLYWLFGHELPFGEDARFERRVREEDAPLLRTRYRGPYAWELEQICQRALQKNPEDRYRSASEIADELQRVAANETIESERRRRFRRLWKWSQRHTGQALLLLLSAMLVIYLPFTPFLGRGALEQAMRAQISFSALAQAGAVMNELRAGARRLERRALDPRIPQLLEHSNPRESPPEMEALARGMDGLSFFSADGTLKARWPRNRGLPPNSFDFSFRDYYQGQLRFAREGKAEVYVARPFYSIGDEVPLLGLSIPVYENGHYVGALLASTRVRATFGAMRMDCDDQGSCMSALLGPRDRDRAAQALPDSLFVLATPGMAPGQKVMISPSLARGICAQLDCTPHDGDQFDLPARRKPLLVEDYQDPVTHVRSLAALAPVGRTGLIVVVATPHDAFAAITRRMVRQILTHLWIPLGLGACLFLILLVAQRLVERRSRRPKSYRTNAPQV